MTFDPSIVSSLISITPSLAKWISRYGADDKAADVIKRVLANELRLNLSVIQSALGKKDLNKGSNLAVILAVIKRLEVSVATQVYEGLDTELVVTLKHLNAKFLNKLRAEKQDLPIPSSISAAKNLNFTTLLGYVIQGSSRSLRSK
jgi:hypothetical protein